MMGGKGVQLTKNEDDFEEEFILKCVSLPEGSWYGDYHILLNCMSTWELQASKAKSLEDQAKG